MKKRPKPTFTIEWWESEVPSNDPFHAHAICDQNGAIVWGQTEGLAKKSEVLRRIEDLFKGRWPVRKRKLPKVAAGTPNEGVDPQ